MKQLTSLHIAAISCIAVASMALAGCEKTAHKKQQQEENKSSAKAEQSATLSYSLSKDDNTKFSLQFVASKSADQAPIKQIIIKHDAPAGEVQVIDTTDSQLLDTTGKAVEVMDFNFDGHNDFRYPLYRTAGPNTPFRYWLYNASTQQFVRSPQLDEVGYVSLDSKQQQVEAQWRDGQEYGKDTYEFNGDTLVKIRREVTQLDSRGQCQKIIQHIISGVSETADCDK